MNFFTTLGKMNQLHRLIDAEKTGNPDVLARRLGISRSTLYRMIEELKSYDAPIEYSRRMETFYYTQNYEFNLSCSIKVITSESELKKIIGGCHSFLPVSKMTWRECNFVLRCFRAIETSSL